VSSHRDSRLRQHALAVFVVSAVLLAGGSAFRSSLIHNRQTSESLARLSAEVSRLRQEQAMPTLVLTRHRQSICYIYALYTLDPPPDARWMRPLKTRVSGTGFVVANGVIATNRHVVEPWFDDDEDEALIARGAVPHLDQLLAFFPGQPKAVTLSNVEVSPTHDLAVARYEVTKATASLRPLPLANSSATPGDAVVVVGYPMGVTAMLAKSPRKVYKRLAYTHETIDIARDLAQHFLIRPSATYGHLGDVVEDRLVYDAPTAQGGSGGPVFNSHGEVIGVNAAYMDGFAGGTLGISIEAIKPLLAEARTHKAAPHVSASAQVADEDKDGDSAPAQFLP
jgi:serine protease Do